MQKVSKLTRSHIEPLTYRQTIETAILDCENAKRIPPPGLFSIAYKGLRYSTCRQVEISFLGMPQIAHFQVEK